MKPSTVDRIRFYLPIVAVAAAITAAGIYFRQDFFRMLPLYISLFVMALSSRVNRYALLLGSINSILYSVVYFSYALYGMAAYALLVSFPVQLTAFINWSKHAYKKSVQFKKLTGKQRILTALCLAAAWGILFVILKRVGNSGYTLLDNTSTVLGILISLLQMLAYIEYTYLMIPSGIISITLYAVMLKENPEQITYLIYAVYCFVCQCAAFYNARKTYREQQSGETEETPAQKP